MSVAGSWRYAVASLGAFALSLALATGTARGQGVADAPGQASAQQATTGQAAMTGADAEDAAPTNIFISLRINSPGDDGPVTQTSTTAVAGEAANDAATAQDGWQHTDAVSEAPQPLPQASAQDAATNQAAASNATATRAKPTNVVVSVRVNSPGDDAPVTQSSAVAVGAESKNTAATAQQARQAQDGTEGVAARPAAPAASPAATPTSSPTTGPADPAPGAVADPPEASPPPAAPAPPTCVSVAPGSATTRIVITIGKSCHAAAAPKHAAPPRPKLRTPAPAHAAPPAPAAPVVHEVAASPAPAASPPARAVAAPPRPAPAKPKATPRPHAAASKSLDPLAASSEAGDLVAAAMSPPPAGQAQYEVMLALLLAMLGAAAVWSYGGTHRYYRLRRWR